MKLYWIVKKQTLTYGKTSLWLIVSLLAVLMLAGRVNAQDGVTVKPTQITVTGTRGTVAARQILLHSAEPLSEVRLIPEDLPRIDMATVLPAGAIQPDMAAATVEPGGVLAIPVQFVLRGVPSGEFAGNLLIVYDGGTVNVPLTVKVKDAWPLPLLVLLVGIALGVGVSTYRAQVRPRDEILVRISQLRAQMRGDPDLPEPFRRRIETELVDVEATLQAEDWGAAGQAIERAEMVWLKWRRTSDDWLTQLAYHAQLVERLHGQDLDIEGNYEREVYQGLEDVLRTLPDFESPDQLRERLRELAAQINDLIQLRTSEEQFHEMCMALPETHEAYQSWQRKSREFAQQMVSLSPDDAAGREKLKANMQEAIAELREVLAQQPLSKEALDPEMAFSLSARGMAGAAGGAFKRVASPPTIRLAYQETQLAAARNRLAIFTALGYVIMVVALAGAGFSELYIAKASFGANAWGDYFALLGWGFAAEATRVSVTEMLRGLSNQKQQE